MPALKSVSAANEEYEYDHLGWNSEAEEKEEDLDKMDDKEESGDEEDDVKRDEVETEDVEALEDDSKERSQSSSGGEQSESEYMEIDLAEIRRDVQCPICLGIIKKTRTVMECLHRFCRECIDKSMRLGNNECPTCRKHCASRRSLRDDPNFDAFIAFLFKNIDKFEEEELAFRQDDEARNKQIQASIAQVSQRQSAALAKKSSGKDAAVLSRSRRSCSGSRRRRNFRKMEQDTSEAHDDDDQNNRGKDSSSDEPCAEILRRKRKKRSTAHPSSSAANNNDNCTGNGSNGTEQAHTSSAENNKDNCAGNGTEKAHPSSLAANNNDNCAGNGTEQAHPTSSAANKNDNCAGNDTEKAHPSSLAANNNDNCAGNGTEQAHHRDSRGISPGLVWNPEFLAWGRGGARSISRQRKHGAKSTRSARLNRLVEYLGSLEDDSVELDIHLKLISLDTKCLPNLLQPYLCCRPTLLVKQLCEYVARQMQLKAEEVELLGYKEGDKAIGNTTSTEKMQSLEDDETLAKLKVDCISSHGYMSVVYRQKKIR